MILTTIAFCVFAPVVQSLEVRVQSGDLSQPMNFTLNSQIRYVLIFQPQQNVNPHRVKAWTSSATPEDPVLIGAELQHDSLTWSVPLALQHSNGTRVSYKNTSRILCDNNLVQNKSEQVQNFTVTLSTSSLVDVDLFLEVDEDTNFYVKNDVKYNVSVSASQPQYFHYKFNISTFGTIIIDIDSYDDVCLTASIQRNRCPVFDLDQDHPSYAGIHYTVQRDGGIVIDRRHFPHGFFLVFVAKVDNYLCTKRLGLFVNQERDPNEIVSTLTFLISEGVGKNDYKRAALMVLIFILTFCLVAVGIVAGFFYLGIDYCSRLCRNITNAEQQNENRNDNAGPSDEIVTEEQQQNENRDDNAGPSGEIVTEQEQQNENRDDNAALLNENIADGDQQNEARDNTALVERQVLNRFVEDFARHPKINRRTSHRYFKFTLNVAIFYIIPVVQLMFTYQAMLNNTGNSDLCYFNFRCANPGPWFFSSLNLSDFNHIFSNIGYLIMGVLFLGVVGLRQWYLPKMDTGIPVNYGIYYGMGTALIAEGVLSACFHICPSQAHFQFDTSFMYVIAVLCMVALYQKRHADITPSASATFTILALITCFAMAGLVESTRLYNTILASIVVIGYFLLCIYISLKIYYFGSVWNQLKHLVGQNWNTFEALRPQEKARFIVVIVANVINYAMLGTAVAFYLKNELDFGSLLLILLMGNAVLYAITYTIMKLIYCECIGLQALIYGLAAFGCWAAAAVYFFDSVTEWKLSPAQSRSKNQACVFLHFFDNHDLWHFFSSAALFLTFMYLLCLDDNIIHRARATITAF